MYNRAKHDRRNGKCRYKPQRRNHESEFNIGGGFLARFPTTSVFAAFAIDDDVTEGDKRRAKHHVQQHLILR